MPYDYYCAACTQHGKVLLGVVVKNRAGVGAAGRVQPAREAAAARVH